MGTQRNINKCLRTAARADERARLEAVLVSRVPSPAEKNPELPYEQASVSAAHLHQQVKSMLRERLSALLMQVERAHTGCESLPGSQEVEKFVRAV